MKETVTQRILSGEAPLVDIEIFQPQPILDSYRLAGKIAPSIKGKGLVDTGASGVCIDISVAAKLNLVSHNAVSIITPGLKNGIWRPSFDIVLKLSFNDDLSHSCQAVSYYLKAQGFIAIIGRNIISKYEFTYRGGNQPSFSFTFEKP